MIKKRIRIFWVMLGMAILLCSCSPKDLQQISVADVKAYLVEKDYYREDMTREKIKGYYLFGGEMTNEWRLYFYDFGFDRESMDGVIKDITSRIDPLEEMKAANYEIYVTDNIIGYNLYARVNNTILVINGDRNMDAVIQMAKDLGYYPE